MNPRTQAWGRARFEEQADSLLLAVRAHATPGRALVRIPGPASASGRRSDGLEGFARTFLLAAFRVAGAGGADPHGLLEWYADGLRHGTDPSSTERWPRMTERRQARVEAASVAIALSETRPWLWDRLDPVTQERVVAWFADIVGTADYGNNWLWFQNVVESFLASVGGPCSQADRDRNEELLERLYVGDGWYSDGAGRDGRLQSFDYYTGWAWHTYPLLDARIRGESLDDRHRDRLRRYLDQAALLVARDGAPLLQGRSLTYRFAMLAPFWAGCLADATRLLPGQTRAVASAVMEHFLERGAVQEDGLLSVGWHGPFPRIRQLYTGAGSPYWASKGFLGLLLPTEDAVWSAEPEALPHWTADHAAALDKPGWLVHTAAADGVVRVLNHGTDRLIEQASTAFPDDPFYRRQSYSSHAAPQVSPGAIAAPVDSHVALVDSRGVPSHRGGIERIHLDAAVAVSRCRPYWLDHGQDSDMSDCACCSGVRLGPALVTASIVRGAEELRLAWIDAVAEGDPSDDPAAPASEESPWPHDPGPWRIRFGGWAVAAPDDGRLDAAVPHPGQARVHRGTDGLRSTVMAVEAVELAGVTGLTDADPLGPVSAVPWVCSEAPLPPGRLAAALVTLSTGEAQSALPEVVVRPDGRPSIRVRWPDGHRTDVPVAPPPPLRGAPT